MTADLQKGLVVIFQGEEVVGEGMGFGVPTIRYSDKDYFSGSALLYILKENPLTMVKEFRMDRILMRLGERLLLDRRLYYRISSYLGVKYRKQKLFRSLLMPFTILQKDLFRAEFVQAPLRGIVVTTYEIHRKGIHVKVDFRGLSKKECKEVIITNEQSSLFFRKYIDSEGLTLLDKEISVWEKVEGEWGCLTSLRSNIGFRLNKVSNATLFRGLERVRGILDWAGLDYKLEPNIESFEYDVAILSEGEYK
jgi:hypothetical protein